MVYRRKIEDFGEYSSVQLYEFCVGKIISGADFDSLPIDKMSSVFVSLLKSRHAILNGKYGLAQEVLDLIDLKNLDDFESAEYHIILARLFEDKKDFIFAVKPLELAIQGYIKSNRLGKALLAKFNLAVCYFRLGKIDESDQIEEEVFSIAKETGISYVQALVLRSRGIGFLRKKFTEEGRSLLEQSIRFFEISGNLSDAAWTSVLLAIVHSDRHRFACEIQRKFNDIKEPRFVQVLDYLLGQKSYDDISDLTARDLITKSDGIVSSVKKKDVRIPVTEKIMDILTKAGKKGATKDELISEVWGSSGSYDSLQARLWMAISRINKRYKTIFRTDDERYYIR